MFTSTTSSNSSSCTFGFPPAFGQANQMSNVFAPRTLHSEALLSSPTGMPTYGGTTAWAFGQTTSPLSSITTYGGLSYTGFGSTMTALGFSPVHPLGSSSSTSVEGSGHSGSNGFECPMAILQGNRKGDSYSMRTLGNANTFGSPVGLSHGTSPPLSTPMAFGTPSSYALGSSTSDGSQGTRSTFGLKPSDWGALERGSKKADYRRTAEATSSTEKLVSISAMPVYNDKSHEELRWEDYNFTGKGGFGLNSSAVQSTSSSLPSFANFSTSQGTGSISATSVKPNLFGKTYTSLATKTTAWKFPGPTQTTSWKCPGPTSTSFTWQPLHFSSSANTSSPTIAAAPLNSFNPFVSLAPTSFTSQPFPFSSSANTSSATVNAVSLNQCNQLVSGTAIFSPASTASSVSVAPLNHNPFTNPFTSLATQTSSSRFSSPTVAAFISSLASTPSSLDTSWSTPIVGPFISMETAPANSRLDSCFNQPATLFNPCVASTQNYNGAITTIIGHGSVSQLSSSRITSMEQPLSAASPFGTLPPEPQMTFDGPQSIQYGIASMPVKYKPTPVKYSLLTARHLSRRNKLPVRKYIPKPNGPKIPYFSDIKEIPAAVFVPRENPRAFFVGPERWATTERLQEEKISGQIYENDRDDFVAYTYSNDPTKEKETISDVPEALEQPGYYTEPQISELEVKERAEPGFCSRVKDFVIGRHGYGSIKFLGETDVRKLRLEAYVQFNNREVVVYMDESKKPPVGEGLNKPAVITLANIKCIDKRSGRQYVDGPKIDKYVNVLKKKAMAQGAEFMSYEPVGGEWKFRVQHF